MSSLSSLIQTKRIELGDGDFVVVKECSFVDYQLFEKAVFVMLRERSDLLKAEGLDQTIKDGDLPPGTIEKLKPIYEKQEAAFSSHFVRVLPKVICDHSITVCGKKKATNEEAAEAILGMSTRAVHVFNEVTNFFSQLVMDRLTEIAEKKETEKKSAEQGES